MTNTCSVAIISLDFTEEITKINNFSFHKIGSIKTLVIRDNVTEIGERAFTGCEKLESVDIPDSVKVINDNAFYLCSGIVNLVSDAVLRRSERARLTTPTYSPIFGTPAALKNGRQLPSETTSDTQETEKYTLIT